MSTLEPSSTLPLSLAGEGVAAQLIRISGGQRTARRLAELGLLPGVELTVLSDNGSLLLLAIGDTRLALSRSLAHSVFVTPLARSTHDA